MKMEPIVSSETSAIRTQTPGNYPKRNKLHLEHCEILKTRIISIVCNFSIPKNFKLNLFIIYFYQSQISSYNDSLYTATKPEDIENMCTTVTLFYILHMPHKICAVGVASTSTTFTPSFHKISQLVQKFKWTYKVKAETRMWSFYF